MADWLSSYPAIKCLLGVEVKKLAFITMCLLVNTIQTISANEIDDAKVQLIDKLLVQTGQSSIAVGKQFSGVFIQRVTEILKESNPDMDPRAYDIIEEVITTTIDEEIVVNNTLAKIMYPIYSKHFTVDELKQMVALYDTDFGKKMISVMPMVTQEGMQAGQIIGQSLGPKIQARIDERLKAEGIKKI